jgi:prepilin-type N-terminal cleavage/methylation domain-containing protein
MNKVVNYFSRKRGNLLNKIRSARSRVAEALRNKFSIFSLLTATKSGRNGLQFNARNRNRGFTLLEILIALGVFSALTLLITGSLLTLNSTQKGMQNSQEVLNELRFSIDLMGKEITSGSAFPDGCQNGCDNIVFASKVRPDVPLRRIEYYLDSEKGMIIKGDQKTYGPCATIPLASDCFQPYTSDKVKINLLQFFVNNKEEGKQVIVNVALQGVILPGSKEEKSFKISTTFSPRLLQDPTALPPSDNVAPQIEITDPTSEDSYSTSASSLVLGGTTSDNVGVTEVRWRNQETGAEGLAFSADGFATWETPSINLASGVINVLMVEARDADANISTDTLAVTATGPPEAPVIISSYSCGYKIGFSWLEVSGARDYHFYRCDGNCTPTTVYNGTRWSTQEPGKKYWWADTGLPEGNRYSYRIRAHNHTTGLFSDYSNKVSRQVSSTPCGGGSGGSGGGSNSFSLSASPNLIRVGVSGSQTTKRKSTKSTIEVQPSGGFDKDVELSASGGPTGIEYKFNPDELEDDEYDDGSKFWVNVPDNTAIGQYTITVEGKGGGKTSTVNVILDVFAKGGGQQ